MLENSGRVIRSSFQTVLHRDSRHSSLESSGDVSSTADQPETAVLGIAGAKARVHLSTIRITLCIGHLMILAAAFTSYLAWLDAKFNWKPREASEENIHDEFDRAITTPVLLLHLSSTQQRILQAVHDYIDHILYITTINMLLYWLVYGVIISCRFGGACDICTLIVTLPHTLFMVMWEIGLSVGLLQVYSMLQHQPCEQDNCHHVMYVKEFYVFWAPCLATLYLLSCPIQLAIAFLPFFIYQLPFQDRDANHQQGLEEGLKGEGQKLGNQTKEEIVKRLERKLCGRKGGRKEGTRLVYNTSPDRDCEDEPDNDYLVSRKLQKKNSAHDMSSLYKCEMPDERMAKGEAQFVEERTGWKKMSAGQAIIQTMGREEYNDELTCYGDSFWWGNRASKQETPHPRLVEADTLADGVTIFTLSDTISSSRDSFNSNSCRNNSHNFRNSLDSFNNSQDCCNNNGTFRNSRNNSFQNSDSFKISSKHGSDNFNKSCDSFYNSCDDSDSFVMGNSVGKAAADDYMEMASTNTDPDHAACLASTTPTTATPLCPANLRSYSCTLATGRCGPVPLSLLVPPSPPISHLRRMSVPVEVLRRTVTQPTNQNRGLLTQPANQNTAYLTQNQNGLYFTPTANQNTLYFTPTANENSAPTEDGTIPADSVANYVCMK